MWLSFCFQVLVCAFLVYVPGYFLLRGFHFRRISSLVSAPIFSISGFYLISFIYSVVGKSVSWLEVFLPCLVIFLIPFFVFCLNKRKRVLHGVNENSFLDSRNSWLCLVCYILFATVIVTYFFVRTLDGPASIYQENDNIFHLEMVRAFIDGGVFFPSWNMKYPSMWHCVVALGINVTGVEIGVGVNAFNFLLSAVIFPSGVFLFLSQLFSTKKRVIWWGSLVAVAFAAFPWGFLLFGPLYPNLAGYSLLPITMSLFVVMLETGQVLRQRIKYIVLFIFAGIALVFLHPNAIFVAIVLLSPYCVHLIMKRAGNGISNEKGKRLRKIFLSLLFVALVLIIWTILFNSSFLSSLVWFQWNSFASKTQAVINALILSLAVVSAPQLTLAFVVICGFLYSLSRKEYRWVAFSYLIVLLMYVVNVSSDGFLKHYLTGFWYTDSFRVAALVALAGIPLGAMGLHAIYEFINKVVMLIQKPKKTKSVFLVSTISIFFIFLNFYPSYEIPRNFEVVTGFGAVEEMLKSGNEETVNVQVYDSDEIAFTKEAKEIIPDGAVVINIPYDGSIYAHALTGLNTMYRAWYGYSSIDENTDDALIRGYLSSISYRDDVKQAVANKQAQYLLVLDKGNQEDNGMYSAPYKRELWTGISSVDDDTPGFEVVLARGDMRLYKIVG